MVYRQMKIGQMISPLGCGCMRLPLRMGRQRLLQI